MILDIRRTRSGILVKFPAEAPHLGREVTVPAEDHLLLGQIVACAVTYGEPLPRRQVIPASSPKDERKLVEAWLQAGGIVKRPRGRIELEDIGL